MDLSVIENRVEKFASKFVSEEKYQESYREQSLQLDSLNQEVNKMKQDFIETDVYLEFYQPCRTMKMVYELINPSFDELPIDAH